jgi:DNA-binding NtrC family response regulator
MVLAPFGTVLVVDDDDALRDAAVEALLQAGVAPFGARSIRGALGLLRSLPGRCLIVLDLTLADGAGEEVLEGLSMIEKSASRYSVLVASANERAEETLRLPFVIGVLKKPYTAAGLVNAVKEYGSGLSRDPGDTGRRTG